MRLPVVHRRGRGPLAGRGRRGCAEEREAGFTGSGCIHAERGVHVERGVHAERVFRGMRTWFHGELMCSRGSGCSRGAVCSWEAGVSMGSGCVHVKRMCFHGVGVKGERMCYCNSDMLM